jgi:hypothetical protein
MLSGNGDCKNVAKVDENDDCERVGLNKRLMGVHGDVTVMPSMADD